MNNNDVINTDMAGLCYDGGYFELKVRTWNQLRENGVSTIKDVMHKSEQELMNFPGIGRHSINDLKENLQELNKKLGTNYWIGEKIPVQLELDWI